MAKKAATDFNMAEEIRNLLRQNRKLSLSEAFAALSEKFPKQKLNKSSFDVAFYAARNKLGIKSSGRRRKKAAGRTVVKQRPAKTKALDLDTLKAAAKFVAQIGDADAAIAAIRQVRTLQIG